LCARILNVTTAVALTLFGAQLIAMLLAVADVVGAAFLPVALVPVTVLCANAIRVRRVARLALSLGAEDRTSVRRVALAVEFSSSWRVSLAVALPPAANCLARSRAPLLRIAIGHAVVLPGMALLPADRKLAKSRRREQVFEALIR